MYCSGPVNDRRCRETPNQAFGVMPFHARTSQDSTPSVEENAVRRLPRRPPEPPSDDFASATLAWLRRSCAPRLRCGRTLVLGALTPLAGFDPSTTGRFSGVHRGAPDRGTSHRAPVYRQVCCGPTVDVAGRLDPASALSTQRRPARLALRRKRPGASSRWSFTTMGGPSGASLRPGRRCVTRRRVPGASITTCGGRLSADSSTRASTGAWP